MVDCSVILAKYGMDGKKDTRTLGSNRLKDHDVKDGDTFDDPRLDKLWNKVTDGTKQLLECECVTHLQVYRLVHSFTNFA